MTYDPFARGEHPVGVRTITLDDATGGRPLVAEVWYPAAPAHAGADLAPATRDRYQLMPGGPTPAQSAVRDAAPAAGTRPLAVFSHGFAGHRRQSTFFTTHLASHGWVVVSADHAGNTFLDLMQLAGRTAGEIWQASMAARPREVRALIDAAARGDLDGLAIDATRVAMTGHSFGGWTSLKVVVDEPRIAAVVALAPAAGVPPLRAALDLAWPRAVPTLILAADRDSLLPVTGLEVVHGELRPPTTLVVVTNTDHMHFCDGARLIHELFRSTGFQLIDSTTPLPPFDELAPARVAHEASLGLGLAHLDAHARENAEAARFLDGDLAALLAARQIAATVSRRQE